VALLSLKAQPQLSLEKSKEQESFNKTMTAPFEFPSSTPPRYKKPTEKRMIKRFIARLLLGDKNVGRLDYLLRRQSKDAWGGPLNGQKIRQQIYSDIMSRIDFQAIVETGTFRGTTTEFFCELWIARVQR
jgi:hypothetical protein